MVSESFIPLPVSHCSEEPDSSAQASQIPPTKLSIHSSKTDQVKNEGSDSGQIKTLTVEELNKDSNPTMKLEQVSIDVADSFPEQKNNESSGYADISITSARVLASATGLNEPLLGNASLSNPMVQNPSSVKEIVLTPEERKELEVFEKRKPFYEKLDSLLNKDTDEFVSSLVPALCVIFAMYAFSIITFILSGKYMTKNQRKYIVTYNWVGASLVFLGQMYLVVKKFIRLDKFARDMNHRNEIFFKSIQKFISRIKDRNQITQIRGDVDEDLGANICEMPIEYRLEYLNETPGYYSFARHCFIIVSFGVVLVMTGILQYCMTMIAWQVITKE